MQRVAVVCFAVLAAFAVLAGLRQDASSETNSRVVDNSDEGRFAASKSWKASESGTGINGDDYLVARPAKKGAHALFEVPVTENGVYAVYVRWPEVRGLNDRVPVGVETPYGTKWTEVDQSEGGGEWVRIGEFEMRRDERFPVRISNNTRGKGKVAADAVKVEMVSSYEEPATAARTEGAAPSETTRTTSATGANVVQYARNFIGTPYGPYPDGGGLQYCKPYKLMDCSCLTRTVFLKFGKTLPDSPAAQYRYGRSIARTAIRPGDLLFYREYGSGITAVRIYSGNGRVIHASNYFGKVVESEMRYLSGYVGAKRLI